MYQNPIYGILNLFDQHSLTALDKDRLKIKSLHVYIDIGSKKKNPDWIKE